jgi:outer membrane protein assembly factor BamA
MGLQLDFQRLSRVNLISYTDNSQLLTPTGYTGYNNLGIGAGFLFDNRHNVFNVRKGFYAEIAMLNYRRAFGANNNFSSIFTDLRVFYPIRKRNILTFQSLGQFTLGDAPFNQYALMGGEMMMRGYYLGRFRDKHFLSIQSEYRMLPLSFAKKFGLAVFASAGMVYNNESKITNQYLKYAGGAGVHYLLFPKKDVWTRLDMAVNNEGGTGLYLSIGCAF